jgi:hypothetical protein
MKPTTMTKWEYLEIRDDAIDGLIERVLSELGEDGWELVTVVSYDEFSRFFFKRPLVIYGGPMRAQDL